jgi:hypothetical protein
VVLSYLNKTIALSPIVKKVAESHHQSVRFKPTVVHGGRVEAYVHIRRGINGDGSLGHAGVGDHLLLLSRDRLLPLLTRINKSNTTANTNTSTKAITTTSTTERTCSTPSSRMMVSDS